MKKIYILIIIIVLLILGLFLIFNKTLKQDEKVNIGVLAPLSGDASIYGINVQKGIFLAVEEINNKGGINGKKINLIIEDSLCNANDAILAYNKLKNINNVSFIIGAVCSSETLGVAPLAQEHKTILISPASTNYLISESGDYIFRTVPSDAMQGKAGAEFAYNEGYRKAAIFYLNNDYGDGLKKVFQTSFENLGGEIVSVESHFFGDKDFKTQLTKIKTKDIDVLYVPSMTFEAGLIIKQAYELGINIQIIGTETYFDELFLNTAQEYANGVIFTSFSEYQGDEASIFLNKYKEKYNEDMGIFADYGYDALYALYYALKECRDLNVDCVKNSLYNIEFIGATGKIDFDERGDVKDKEFLIYVVEDGKFKLR